MAAAGNIACPFARARSARAFGSLRRVRLKLPPPSPGRRDNLDCFAGLDLGFGAARQNLDAAVIAADGIASEFTFVPAHHASIGDGAMAAEDRRLHRP